MLMHWIGRLGLEPDEAADIAQEVLMSLMVRMPTFRYDPEQSFRSWLRTVTINKTRDFLRRKKTRTLHESKKITEPDDSPQSLFTDHEFHQALARQALHLMQAEFEDTTWRACWASAVEGRKAPEIARELGITVNAVYLAKGRVLKRLRSELEGMI